MSLLIGGVAQGDSLGKLELRLASYAHRLGGPPRYVPRPVGWASAWRPLKGKGPEVAIFVILKESKSIF
jgi:hypothetical protein